MTELEALKQQRKEIDNKIKELTSDAYYAGRAKFYFDKGTGCNRFNYNVSVLIPEKHFDKKLKRLYPETPNHKRYSCVCRADDRNDAVKELKEVIDDLQKLYEKLMTEHADMAEWQTPET